MPPSKITYDLPAGVPGSVVREDNGNGFVWHTTGRCKLLTSFKASCTLKPAPALAA